MQSSTPHATGKRVSGIVQFHIFTGVKITVQRIFHKCEQDGNGCGREVHCCLIGASSPFHDCDRNLVGDSTQVDQDYEQNVNADTADGARC
jgi:hypothetical protein